MARRVDVKVNLDSNVDKEISKDSKAVDKATRELKEFGDKGSKSIRKASKEAEKSVKSFKALGTGIGKVAAVLGAGVIAKQLTDLAFAQADLQDETIKTARAIGIEVESLQSLRRSAELGGASVGELDAGVRKLSKNIFDAVGGTGEAVDVFKDLGIELQNTDGTLRSTEDVLLDVSDAFNKLEDGTAKNAQAQLLFGRSGTKLINTLNQGSDAIKSQREQLDKLGATFTREDAENAEKFNDAFADFQRSVGGVFRNLVNEVLPKLTPLLIDAADTIGRMSRNYKEFVSLTANTDYLQEVTELAEKQARVAKELKEQEEILARFQKSGFIPPSVQENVGRLSTELRNIKNEIKDLQSEAVGSGENGTDPATENNKINQKIISDNEERREKERESQIEFEKSLYMESLRAQAKASTAKIRLKTEEFQKTKALEEQEQKLILQTSSLAISSLRQIFGETKGFAIADIIINTARGIQRSFADLGPPFNFIQAGLIGASGAAQLAKVNSAKFADGGFVSGPGNSRSDSIPASLSNGEFVINARSTAENRDILEAINSGQNVRSNVNVTINAGAGTDLDSLAQVVTNAVRRATDLGLEPSIV